MSGYPEADPPGEPQQPPPPPHPPHFQLSTPDSQLARRRRGRPPHPDLLTPREWEVLGLLRERLTNRQIAERLGVTLHAARYHVSQIISKLGVTTREQAAASRPEPALERGRGIPASPRRRWWVPVLAWLRPLTLAKAAGVAASVAAVAALAVLAWGVLQTAGDGDATQITAAGNTFPEVAFATEGGKLVLSSADGTVQRTLLERCDNAIIWAPGGEHLVCISGAGEDPLLESVILDLGGAALFRFQADGGSFNWAPDGQRYAYTRTRLGGTDLFVGNFTSAEAFSIAYAESPVWSPDGRLAAYRPPGLDLGGSDTAFLDIYRGGEATAIPGDYRPLVWVRSSADAPIVASNYVPPLDVAARYEASLLVLATRQPVRIPELDDSNQFWVSPDGTRGVLISRTEEIGLSAIDFRTLEINPIPGSRISFPSDFIPRQHVMFSADGAYVYWADARAPLGIYRAALDGGAAELIGSITGVGRADFSRDFSKVAYFAIGSGTAPELWTANLDGSDPRRLVVLNAFAWRPAP